MGSDVRNIEGFVSLGGEVPHVDPGEVVIVGLDVPATPENWFAQCARLQDETDETLAEYAEEILRTGRVDDPIDVYRDGEKLVVLDGRRSVRAARMARAKQAERRVPTADRVTVRVLLRRGPPEELFRQNVDSHKHKPLTPIQRARLFVLYHARTGEDLKKTGAFFAVDPWTVRKMLAVFDLDESIQRKIDAGILPLHATLQLRGKNRAEQRAIVEKLIATGATKGLRGKRAIERAKRGESFEDVDRGRPFTPAFLDRWRRAIRTLPSGGDDYRTLLAFLDFLLGGPLPESASLDRRLFGTLVEAGWKNGEKPHRSRKLTDADLALLDDK